MFQERVKCKLRLRGEISSPLLELAGIKRTLTAGFFLEYSLTMPGRPQLKDNFVVSPNNFEAEKVLYDEKENIFILYNDSVFQGWPLSLDNNLDKLFEEFGTLKSHGWIFCSSNKQLEEKFDKL